jgi:diketogulonate reductase-like aldo/keto reductase
MSKFRTIDGVRVPSFLYGTAWKEDRTEPLVTAALAAGFRGIDTANQRRHYHEAGVGRAIARSGVEREELFIQSKYTYAEGQDHRLPYDSRADYPTQVRQSCASSLEHLGIERLDSLLLHGPHTRTNLSKADVEVWKAMEALQREGKTRLIGASNVTDGQLSMLCAVAEVRPAFVQNRCYARLGWDREVREVCAVEGVVYQGFSLLTANVAELRSPTVARIAARHDRSAAQVIFRFALQLGMICLTGTSSPEHMREDLAVHDFVLDPDEVAAIERISG